MKYVILIVKPGHEPEFVLEPDSLYVARFDDPRVAEDARARTGICHRVPSAVIPLPESIGTTFWDLFTVVSMSTVPPPFSWPGHVRAMLASLPVDVRREMIQRFCRGCGEEQPETGPGCQCWNDD